jgi:hypothetical protein
MTRQTNVLTCKSEELYLVMALIENKLALAWLRKFDGRKFLLIQLQCCLNIMCQCLTTTMDMRRIMRRTTAPYSRIQVRLEPEISRLPGLKALPTLLIAPSASKVLLVRSPGMHSYPSWTKFSDQGNAQTLHC